MYTKFRYTAVKRWLQRLRTPPKASDSGKKCVPNAAQRRVLESVINRCAVEEKEFRTACPPHRVSEPFQGCLLAPPGTGKTRCILWLLEFFEEVCCWENGVQFQTIASQNTMAAAIQGQTSHSWGEVPINATEGSAGDLKKTKDGISTLFLKCMSLRWLINDEISTSGLVVLGILESNVRKACKRHLHATDTTGNARAWGGLNILTGGDWLQLPPVKAKSIFRNPFLKDYVGPERRMSQIFWGLDGQALPNSPEYLFELTEQCRSKDVWLNAMLQQDRVGQESFTVWAFTHSLPTMQVGTWLPGAAVPLCGNAECQKLQETMARGGA